jgi:hypothetical protein
MAPLYLPRFSPDSGASFVCGQSDALQTVDQVQPPSLPDSGQKLNTVCSAAIFISIIGFSR